jgi:sulfide dehydrogenase cytochrome subunit
MSSCIQKINFFLKAWAIFIFVIQANAGETNPHIQTLAASCAACHGAQGNSLGGTPVLAGLNQQYFVNQMLAFRKNGRDSTVMHRHAKGLNLDEINQLAIYFSEQKRTSSLKLQTQMMDSNRGY